MTNSQALTARREEARQGPPCSRRAADPAAEGPAGDCASAAHVHPSDHSLAGVQHMGAKLVKLYEVPWAMLTVVKYQKLTHRVSAHPVERSACHSV